MRMRAGLLIVVMCGAGVLAGCSGLGSASGDLGPGITGPVPGEEAAPPPPDSDAWPRRWQLANAQVTLYPPQAESWRGNRLTFRCAVASRANGASDEISGVIWGTARTQVDRIARAVSLEDPQLTRSSFPSLPDDGASLRSELQSQLPSSLQAMALDRLEASLAAAGGADTQGCRCAQRSARDLRQLHGGSLDSDRWPPGLAARARDALRARPQYARGHPARGAERQPLSARLRRLAQRRCGPRAVAPGDEHATWHRRRRFGPRAERGSSICSTEAAFSPDRRSALARPRST